MFTYRVCFLHPYPPPMGARAMNVVTSRKFFRLFYFFSSDFLAYFRCKILLLVNIKSSRNLAVLIA
nr:MAG TPA: hypothetical protein [Caudoviricetes sp.]